MLNTLPPSLQHYFAKQDTINWEDVLKSGELSSLSKASRRWYFRGFIYC